MDTITALRQRVDGPDDGFVDREQWDKSDNSWPRMKPYEPSGFGRFDRLVLAVGPRILYGGKDCANKISAAAVCGQDLPIKADDSLHCIIMPERERFATNVAYAASLAHELVHWWEARHLPWKITRGLSGGEEALFAILGAFPEHYAIGELVAEIGANLLLVSTGVIAEGELFDPSPSYIRGYLRGLDDRDDAFIHAAQRAKNAVDALLSA